MKTALQKHKQSWVRPRQQFSNEGLLDLQLKQWTWHFVVQPGRKLWQDSEKHTGCDSGTIFALNKR